MEKAACAPNQQTCLLRSEVQAPPPSSSLLKMAIICVISFPKEWGKSNYIIIFASEKLPSAVISALQDCLAVPEVRLLSQVERNDLHAGVSISVEPASLVSSPLYLTPPRAPRQPGRNDLHVEGGHLSLCQETRAGPNHPQDHGLFRKAVCSIGSGSV